MAIVSGRPEGDRRGNNEDRKRRRTWMLLKFGNGVNAPCHWCRKPLDFETLTVDRHPKQGRDGGRYTRDNIVPACGTCNFGRRSANTQT